MKFNSIHCRHPSENKISSLYCVHDGFIIFLIYFEIVAIRTIQSDSSLLYFYLKIHGKIQHFVMFIISSHSFFLSSSNLFSSCYNLSNLLFKNLYLLLEKCVQFTFYSVVMLSFRTFELKSV